jgi:hypothetical protein
LVVSRLIALAVSMLEPPPTATIASQGPVLAGPVDGGPHALVGRLDVRAVEDPRLDAEPVIWSATRCGWPVAATPGSVTTRTRRAGLAQVVADLVGGAGPNLSCGAP